MKCLVIEPTHAAAGSVYYSRRRVSPLMESASAERFALRRTAIGHIMSTSPEWLEINARFRIPYAEFEFTFARSSGPGGQNVNKVSSKAQLRWRPRESPSIPDEVRFDLLSRIDSHLTIDGDLLVVSQLYRDQPRNRADCIEKLLSILQTALIVPKTRKKSKPSRAAKARRLRDKKLSSEKKVSRRKPADDPDR